MNLPFEKLRTLTPGDSPFRLKGLAYKGVIAMISKETPGGLAPLIADLPYAIQMFLTQSFIAAEWYDIMPLPLLTAAGAARMKEDHASYAARQCKAQAESDMRGPYRFLFRLLGSPELVANRFALATKQYFDFGEATNQKKAEGHLELHRTGVPTMILPWYKTVAVAYMEFAMQLVRTKKVEIRIQNEKRGPSVKSYDTTDFDFVMDYA